MKTTLGVGALVCIIFFSSLVSAPFALAQTNSYNLIGYWKLNEGTGDIAYDSSGNNNNGLISGALNWVQGQNGNALYFDGTDNFVSIPDNLIANSKIITVAIWFKTSYSGVLIGCENGQFPSFEFEYVPLIYVGSDGKLRAQFWIGGPSQSETPITSTSTVNDGKWHQAVLVGNLNTQYLYLDGNLIGTLSGTITPLTMSTNDIGLSFWEGWPSSEGDWGFFSGLIDNVQIYYQALTADQIQSLYSTDNLSGTTAPTSTSTSSSSTSSPTSTPTSISTPISTQTGIPNSGLIAWWKLNEGSDTTILDSSGNNNDGTINGCTWVNTAGTSDLSFNGQSSYVSLPSLDLSTSTQLTVAAWINSNLVQPGFFIYHGDLGEFGLGNGNLSQCAGNNPTQAYFCVKLSDADWYGLYSPSMTPNTWNQIVAVWTQGSSLKIYINGVLAAEDDNIPNLGLFNPGSWFPSSLGIYARNQWVGISTQQYWFEGQLSNVMVYGTALSGSEVQTLYSSQAGSVPPPTSTSVPIVSPQPTPALSPSPNLELSCVSFTSNAVFNVDINGNLTFNGVGLQGAPIILYYSIDGGDSWQGLTMVNTASDGSFLAEWLPSVTGDFLVKATYAGDSSYSSVSTVVSLVVVPFTSQGVNDVFSVASNATVSALAFNSSSDELTFTVSGSSGSAYVDTFISKSLIGDVSTLQIYLDGNPLNYTTTSEGSSWLIYFTFGLCTHTVVINLGAAASKPTIAPLEIIAIGIVAATLIVAISLSLRRKLNT